MDKDLLVTRLQIIAEDLATLEINTMVIPGLTGRKMPSVHRALVEIAECYDQALKSVDEEYGVGDYKEIVAAFERIREESEKAIPTFKDKTMASLKQQKLFVIVQRIEANAGEVLSILKEMKRFTKQDPNSDDLKLAPQNQLRIRRIWDVGTEEVVMQTMINLNGDIVTRVTESYATDEFKMLHRIHHDSVSTTLNMWKELVATVAAFFTQLVGRFKTP